MSVLKNDSSHATRTSARWRSFAPLVPIAAAALAHGGAVDGGLVFDDRHVLGPGSAMAAGDWWRAAFGEPHTSLANRPLAALSLSVLRFSDSDATSYRWGSWLFHLLNTWLVFAVLRSTCRAPAAAAWLRERATGFALAVAALWGCHPLTVDAVAYPTQRSMLVMGTCFLAAIHGLQRDALRRGFTWWKLLAVLATAGGMASKEEFVAAPILLMLFERAFLATNAAELRGRRAFWVALCSTWLVLAACVLGGPHNPTVGSSAASGVGPLEWLYTQSFVLWHYLGNVVWPGSLQGAYDQGIVVRFSSAFLPMAGLALLAVAAALQWRRRPWLAWCGATFFLLLGPTSSVLPIVTEPVADRRMYLPVLAVMGPAAVFLVRFSGRWAWPSAARGTPGWLLVLALVSVLAVATRAHSAKYRDHVSFWTAAYHDNELTNRSLASSLVLAGYCEALQAQGKDAEAMVVIRRAMECPTRLDQVVLKFVELLWNQQDLVECERVLRDLARRRPNLAKCRANLASVLLALHERDRGRGVATVADPRLEEARQAALEAHAARKNPADLGLAGLALRWMGRLAEAEATLLEALRQGTRDPGTPRALCGLLVDQGRGEEAAELADRVPLQNKADVPLLARVMHVLARKGRNDRAMAVARRILALEPAHDGAQALVSRSGESRK